MGPKDYKQASDAKLCRAAPAEKAARDELAARYYPRGLENLERFPAGMDHVAILERALDRTIRAMNEGRAERFGPYFLVTLRSVAGDEVKRYRRQVPTTTLEETVVSDRQGANPEAAAVDAVEGQDNRQRIDAALIHLSKAEREVFQARVYAGLTSEETAELLGLSRSVVKNRYYHARQKLRKLLRNE